MIDHILSETEAEKIVYVGHSQGTTVFYVMASTRPEYNSKIKVQISLAPIGAISHATSAFRYMAPYAKQIHVSTSLYYRIHSYATVQL